MLNWERELIGLYISDHPLTPYQETFRQIVSYFSGQLSEAQHEEKVRVAGLVTSVRPYMTKTNKPMGFVTLEDIQGNIDLVLFPRTWEKTREMLTVGQIVIVEGKVDANSTPPKILVDTARTEIKILEPVKDASPQSKPIPDSAFEAVSEPKPDSYVKNLKIQSTQPRSSSVQSKPDPVKEMIQKPKQNGPLTKNIPARPGVPSPTGQAAEKPAENYGTRNSVEEIWNDDNVPPPPDNFPDDWDVQWQPSFEEDSIAARPESVVRDGVSDTPPQREAEESVENKSNEREQVDFPREVLSVQPIDSVAPKSNELPPSLYIPLAQEEKVKEHPPQQITVMLRSTGDKERDKRRIKSIYGTLISFHGHDRFSFQIFEDGKRYLIDFPNDTTRVCHEVLERLMKLMGEESWRVEEITFQ